MTVAVNSFDVFDTLLARRSGSPEALLHRLEHESGVPGLAAARRAADQALWHRGQPYLLADLWQETGRALGLDAAQVQRLADREIALEHAEVIPITENLAQVRDGDLLVSDSYLPRDVVASLLRQAGLDRAVALVVTNDGKARGWVWPRLAAQVQIRRHLGNDPHADVRSPEAAGIPAELYPDAAPTPLERLLAAQGWPALALWVRQARLANPFPAAQAAQRQLWLLTCQHNVPLLYLASLLLEEYAAPQPVPALYFVSRDGWLWRRLYQALFPHRPAHYLLTSRQCLLKPSADYLAYFRTTWRPGGIIVDLLSTGASWSRFFAGLGTRGRCFFLGRIDDYAYLPDAGPPEAWLDLHAVLRTSALGTPFTKAVELLNYAPHAGVEDVVWLAGQAALPVLAPTLEYAVALPEAAQACLDHCLGSLGHYPALRQPPPRPVVELVRHLLRGICTDPRLPALYPGHLAADEVYLQRLLG